MNVTDLETERSRSTEVYKDYTNEVEVLKRSENFEILLTKLRDILKTLAVDCNKRMVYIRRY